MKEIREEGFWLPVPQKPGWRPHSTCVNGKPQTCWSSGASYLSNCLFAVKQNLKKLANSG